MPQTTLSLTHAPEVSARAPPRRGLLARGAGFVRGAGFNERGGVSRPCFLSCWSRRNEARTLVPRGVPQRAGRLLLAQRTGSDGRDVGPGGGRAQAAATWGRACATLGRAQDALYWRRDSGRSGTHLPDRNQESPSGRGRGGRWAGGRRGFGGKESFEGRRLKQPGNKSPWRMLRNGKELASVTYSPP